MHPSFTHHKSRFRAFLSPALAVVILLAGILLAATLCTAREPQANAVPNIFEPRSTPADSIRHLSFFVLSITGLIFLVVFSLLTYVIVKFRRKAGDRGSEPAQVYGSTQIELAWTVIPILIVAVLFAATARVIHAIQDAPKPPTAIEVTVIGHQFWWEFRYPGLVSLQPTNSMFP
jgi:cytochrome c oxidase subunit 2